VRCECDQIHSEAFEIKHIRKYIALGRALADLEFYHAQQFNWKLTCTSRECPHYRVGVFNATFDPCIECQTEGDV